MTDAKKSEWVIPAVPGAATSDEIAALMHELLFLHSAISSSANRPNIRSGSISARWWEELGTAICSRIEDLGKRAKKISQSADVEIQLLASGVIDWEARCGASPEQLAHLAMTMAGHTSDRM